MSPRSVLSHLTVGHTLKIKQCPTLTLSRIRSLAGWCGTLWRKVKLGSNQAQYHFVAMYLIRIAKLLARGVGELYAAVDVLAGIDLEGLEFHYDIERLNRTYIIGKVGADAE